MFNFIKNSLQKIYSAVTGKLQGLFGTSQVDATTLLQLSQILLEADLGIVATKEIIKQLEVAAQAGKLQTGVELKSKLQELLIAQLQLPVIPLGQVILLVGINGSGKTTLASKLAAYYQAAGKRVLLVAADTFRAAAVEQLQTWGQRLGIEVVSGLDGQDPAAVVYQGCEKFKQQQFDILIIDTAGRLQTKTHLMQELAKIKRVVTKQLPNQIISTLLTVDAMLGQNSLIQAEQFHGVTDLSGVVLTKMDGTGKGGIVVAIAQQLKLPVRFISYGESAQQLRQFETAQYVQELLGD